MKKNIAPNPHYYVVRMTPELDAPENAELVSHMRQHTLHVYAFSTQLMDARYVRDEIANETPVAHRKQAQAAVAEFMDRHYVPGANSPYTDPDDMTYLALVRVH